nr:ATP-binding protein [uncultured Pseudomonas sp.]
MNKSPLWLWVGVRMTLLAVTAVITILCIMTAYYWLADARIEQAMASQDRAAFNAALSDVEGNRDVLWKIIEKYHDINEFLPGFTDNSDLWALLSFVIAVLPITIVLGFLLSRPLTAHFSRFAEAARKVATGDLSVRVAQHGHEPSEIQVLCTDFNAMVEKLGVYEREVRESSSNLAHELRTPLNAALGRIQGMLDDVFPLSADQLVLVQSQLNNLNNLVGDLHLLSLAQAGQLHLKVSEFCVSTLIEERLAWFAPQFEKASMTVTTSFRQPLRLTGDYGRVGQLINILIENSIKYASYGKELTVTADCDNGQVCVEFLDRGQGVEEQDLRNMFVRFWRAEQSRSRVSGGGGLGLSIAEVICEAHRGMICAQRRDGGGLAVRVTLPLAPAPDLQLI